MWERDDSHPVRETQIVGEWVPPCGNLGMLQLVFFFPNTSHFQKSIFFPLDFSEVKKHPVKRIFSLLFCSLLLKLICSTFRVFGKGTNTRSQLLAGVCCYRSGRGISDITKGWLKMEEGRESKGLSFLFLTVRIETQIMAIKTLLKWILWSYGTLEKYNMNMNTRFSQS